MKKTATLLSILFIGFYAQAESMPQTKSATQVESVQAEVDPEKTGFFSFNLGGEVIPANSFEYYTSVVGLAFGGKISQHSSFRAGIKATIARIEQSFLTFQYGYSFIEGSQWVPGADVALLIGFKKDPEKEKERIFKVSTLSVGAELGPYLKAHISRSHALLLRVGVTYDTSTDDEFDLTNLRIYLNLGLQWYL